MKSSKISYTVIVGLTAIITPLLAVTESEVRNRITETFDNAREAFLDDPSGLKAQEVLNRSRLIIDTIQPYFYGVPGALHEHTPERQARVEQVEGWLQEYEPLLVNLINTLNSPATDSGVVVDLVKFSEPTPEIERALLNVARSETARPENAAAAYDGIFFLELDDAQVRQEVVSKLEWIDDRHSRSKTAASLRNLGATSWAMPEMLEYWRKLLSVPFAPENYPERGGANKLAVQYRWAASALTYFGVAENDLVELVRERAAELRDSGEHHRTIEKLNFAAEVLEGKRPPEIAVNWKGQLLGASKTAIQRSDSLDKKVEESPRGQVAKGTTIEEDPRPPVNRDDNVESNIPKWAWILGGLALLVIVIILLRAAKGKSDQS